MTEKQFNICDSEEAEYASHDSGWIPLYERYPKEGESVAILCRDGTWEISWLQDGAWGGRFNYRSMWEVSHWRPLPEPPEYDRPFKMTDMQFNTCVSEAAEYASRDSYISELSLSSMWGDTESSEIPPERIATLGNIWDACNRSVKDIASAAGCSQRKLAARFCIPYRTVEDWCTGKRECNIYIRLMMQECLGILIR